MEKKIILIDKSAIEDVAKMLDIDIKGIDIDKIAGFDNDGIIYNNIFDIMKLVDKQKGVEDFESFKNLAIQGKLDQLYLMIKGRNCCEKSS